MNANKALSVGKILTMLLVTYMAFSLNTVVAQTNNGRPEVKYRLVTGVIDQIDTRNNAIMMNDKIYQLSPSVEVKNANGEILSTRSLRTKMNVRLELKYTLAENGNYYTGEVIRVLIQ